MKYIQLHADNIADEHICCAFSDKKCASSYELKKQWLNQQFKQDYVFKRLDERAKVFIEYGPAEHAWVPVAAPNYMMLGCFWVSGKYKQQGHGKTLLHEAVKAAKKQKMQGLVTVAGTKKFHFMSDTKWLLRQGFEEVERLPYGFSLLAMPFSKKAELPKFNRSVQSGQCSTKQGLAAYYSNRCPYSEYYVRESLVATAKKHDLPLKIIQLKTLKQAQSAPTPATIFSLFIDGHFATTDVSACMGKRFDKLIKTL